MELEENAFEGANLDGVRNYIRRVKAEENRAKDGALLFVALGLTAFGAHELVTGNTHGDPESVEAATAIAGLMSLGYARATYKAHQAVQRFKTR